MSSPVYQRIKSYGSLPSPAGVAIELWQVSRNPDAKIADITALIEADPATAARILKFANSAFAGVREPVCDLQHAIVLLGMRTVVNLSLGFSLISSNKHGACENFDYESFWSESALRAATARHLSPAPQSPNEAFTCGLLAQIGRLALATVFPEQYAEVQQFCQHNCMAKLVELERKMFEIDHNQLTAEMLADWQLSSDFCLAVLHQDAPQRSTLDPESAAARLAQLLHLGGLMGPLLQRDNVRQEYFANLLAAAHRMCIPRDDFPEVFDSISQDWQRTSEILPIRTHPVGKWDELYSRSRERAAVAAMPSAKLLGTAGERSGWM